MNSDDQGAAEPQLSATQAQGSPTPEPQMRLTIDAVDTSAGTMLARTPLRRPEDGLSSIGFRKLLVVEGLSAFIDNFWRITISLVAVDMVAQGQSGAAFLAQASVLFVLPFLLFSGYAGHLADNWPKKQVIVLAKSVELGTLIFALLATWGDDLDFVLASLFMLGVRSTLMLPAKYALLPEILPYGDISKGNGRIELVRFLSVVIGILAASGLYLAFGLPVATFLALIVSGLGLIFALGIAKGTGPFVKRRFDLNPWGEIFKGLAALKGDGATWLTVTGLAYGWFLITLFQLVAGMYARHSLELTGSAAEFFPLWGMVGIAVGAWAAGQLSHNRVELGIMPFGAMGTAITMLVLASTSDPDTARNGLICAGFFAGLVLVPLQSNLQARAEAETRGRMIAMSNFLNVAAVSVAFVIFGLYKSPEFTTEGGWTFLTDEPMIGTRWLIGLFALVTGVLTVWLTMLVPVFLTRFLVWVITHTVYRVKGFGIENVPSGGALLVSNHISYVDYIFIGAVLPRNVRFLARRSLFNTPVIKQIFTLMHVIPIEVNDSPEATEASIEKARKELREGKLVCIFAEGTISRHGQMLMFRRGLEKIVDGIDVPIVPVYLANVWGSIFSFKDGRFFTKIPSRPWIPVTVSFGQPMPPESSAGDVRQMVQELGSEALTHYRKPYDLVSLNVIRALKTFRREFKMSDARTGATWTGLDVLSRALIVSRRLRKVKTEARMLGIALPICRENALVNLAATLAGKVTVNLRLDMEWSDYRAALIQAGVKVVITSRSVESTMDLSAVDEVIYVEDLLFGLHPFKIQSTKVAAMAIPSALLLAIFGSTGRNAHDLFTVLWSKDGTSRHPGVMLTHHNVLSSVEGIHQIFHLDAGEDKVTGIVPFCNAIGQIVTLYLPVLKGVSVVYQDELMGDEACATTIQKHRTTMVLGSPKFYQTLLKTASREQLSSIRYSVFGLGSLSDEDIEEVNEKLGLELLEGYGSDEIAPCITVNIPNFVTSGPRPKKQVGNKPGTPGHPVPNVAVRVVHPTTGKPQPVDIEGKVMVRGPMMTRGYIGRPELSYDLFGQGWFDTGDKGFIDKDGFLNLTEKKTWVLDPINYQPAQRIAPEKTEG